MRTTTRFPISFPFLWPVSLGLGTALLALTLPADRAGAETPTTLLHAFDFIDGMDPHGSLISVGNDLYGMTNLGGTDSGVLYRLDKNGDSLSVVHNFTSGTGIYPYGTLAEVDGRLYGLTEGTTYSEIQGVLFRLELDGSNYTLLHSFQGSGANDGARPHGAPVHDNGILYGFTVDGGPADGGTVFRYVLANGNYEILHAFDSVLPTGGAHPYGSPLIVGDALYGMTRDGGSGANGDDGTVFRMDISGSGFQVLHSFTRLQANNGAEPYGDLILVDGALFGMTRLGGSDANAGKGTIFRIGTDGSGFQVLHRFRGPDYNPEGDDDGMEPYGSLAVYGSYLYGMTSFGGSNGSTDGTIFRIRPDGTGYEVLHNFAGGLMDGDVPWYAKPLCEDGVLYAPTRFGGSGNNYGAVVSMAIDSPVAVPEAPARPGGALLTVGTPSPNPAVAGSPLVLPFYLPQPEVVVLELYTPAGRLVARRPAEAFGVAGRHRIRWSPPELTAGTYYLRVRTSTGSAGSTPWTVLR